MRRPEGDHKRGEEYAHVDVVWRQRLRRRAVAESGEHVDALEASLGHGDDRLLAKEDHQAFETAEGNLSSYDWIVEM